MLINPFICLRKKTSFFKVKFVIKNKALPQVLLVFVLFSLFSTISSNITLRQHKQQTWMSKSCLKYMDWMKKTSRLIEQ